MSSTEENKESCPPCIQRAGHKQVPHDKVNIETISDCPPGTEAVTTPENTSTCKKPSDNQAGKTSDGGAAGGGGGAPECYMAQPEDYLPTAKEQPMGPLGPWATGRVDWGPLAGLTGTRPVVNRYSITRYSEGEWRRRNTEVLQEVQSNLQNSYLVEYNAKNTMTETFATADKRQGDNTKRLQMRTQDLYRFKSELERALAAMTLEVDTLEHERSRLKSAAGVLSLPESIAGECLERRTGRLDHDLARDEVEECLIKEVALCAELRELYNKVLRDANLQLAEDKDAKMRLEYDWSDKQESFDIDNFNSMLTSKSNITLWKLGSVKLAENQSSLEHWEHFTRETLALAEAVRQKSSIFRSTLDSILLNAARDLRAQADMVDLALAKNIACTEELRMRLEGDLAKVLQRLADTERLIDNLKDGIVRMDMATKLVQTRLDNRLHRPRVENCRDVACFSLMDEVKSIQDGVTAMKAQLAISEAMKASLTKTRADMERDIIAKRKTIQIDRGRCQTVRAHYPSVTALGGH